MMKVAEAQAAVSTPSTSQPPIYRKVVPNTNISYAQLTGRSVVLFSFGKFLFDLIFNTGSSVLEKYVLPLIGVIAGSLMNIYMGIEDALPDLQVFPRSESTGSEHRAAVEHTDVSEMPQSRAAFG